MVRIKNPHIFHAAMGICHIRSPVKIRRLGQTVFEKLPQPRCFVPSDVGRCVCRRRVIFKYLLDAISD